MSTEPLSVATRYGSLPSLFWRVKLSAPIFKDDPDALLSLIRLVVPSCDSSKSSSLPIPILALSANSSLLSDLSHTTLAAAPVKVTSSFNVEVPATSILLLASIAPVNVVTPATWTLSTSKCPSISTNGLLISILPANVDTPDILKFLAVISSLGEIIGPVNCAAVITPVSYTHLTLPTKA